MSKQTTRVLRSDRQLVSVMRQLRFVEDPALATPETKLRLIEQFFEDYENTDQDTVLFAPELVVVTRAILSGKRPVRLVYLTDFEGEELPETNVVRALQPDDEIIG